MLFSKPLYFALFLPLTALFYWLAVNYKKHTFSIFILIVASVIFYVTWSVKFFGLLLFSATINYLIASQLMSERQSLRRALFALAIAFNIGLLGYFKYFNFFLETFNECLGSNFRLINLILPLGISFYTFQQLAYVVDAYKNKVKHCSFAEYILFVIYFPQLVAGPIVHYADVLPQFRTIKTVDWNSMYKGIMIFILGLAKKILVADTLGHYVQMGYANIDQLGLISAWIISLAYTMQLYFDFSGYADMAIGSGLLFGIRLPENFNSPYKALHIQDFWRRWHITLSTFLKDYIYIPLGGNRCSEPRVLLNLFLTFFIGGIWHGAGWTFMIWGALHGTAMMIYHLWKKLGFQLHKTLSWFITLNFINLTWIFFRADSVTSARTFIIKLVDLRWLKEITPFMTLKELRALICGHTGHTGLGYLQLIQLGFSIIGLIFFVKYIQNTSQLATKNITPHWFKTGAMLAMVWIIWVITSCRVYEVDFIYWQF